MRPPIPNPSTASGPTLGSLIAGKFELGRAAAPSLLAMLPRVIAISAVEANAHPAITSALQLILAESVAPGRASILVLQRLADVLFISTLRDIKAIDAELSRYGSFTSFTSATAPVTGS